MNPLFNIQRPKCYANSTLLDRQTMSVIDDPENVVGSIRLIVLFESENLVLHAFNIS